MKTGTSQEIGQEPTSPIPMTPAPTAAPGVDAFVRLHSQYAQHLKLSNNYSSLLNGAEVLAISANVQAGSK